MALLTECFPFFTLSYKYFTPRSEEGIRISFGALSLLERIQLWRLSYFGCGCACCVTNNQLFS